MASVPNMRLGPAAQAGGGTIPPEGEGGDFFARLLSSTSILEGATELSIPSEPMPEGETAPEDGSAEGEEILLALSNGMAFQPVVVPAQPAGPEAEAAPQAPNGEAMPTLAAAQLAATPVAPAIEGDPAPARPIRPQAQPALAAAQFEPAEALPPEVEQKVAVAVRAATAKEGPAPAAAPAAGEALLAPAGLLREGKPARTTDRPASAGVSAAGTDKTAATSAAGTPQPLPTPSAIAAVVGPDLALAAQSKAPNVQQPQDVAQQLIEHDLDLAQDGEWLDQLARDIARSGDSEGPMRFRLHPRTLGHLQVELSQGDKGASIRLTVETEAARAIIADAQPRLMSEARAQGVRVAETHVDLAGARDHAAGEQRRHEDGRQGATIRTARTAAGEAEAVATDRRGRSERYA